MKRSLYISTILVFSIVISGLYSCNKKDHHETYEEPGFFVTNYTPEPYDTINVEAVKINTPNGFSSITAKLSSNTNNDSLWLGRKPDKGNKMDGYARYYYTSEDTASAVITLTVEQLSGQSFTRQIHINTRLPQSYRTVADFFKYKYNDIYKIAQQSDYWENVDSSINNQNKGFTDMDWTATIFAVPDGSFDHLIDLAILPDGEDATIDNMTAATANSLIGTIIIDGKLRNGQRTIYPDSLYVFEREADRNFSMDNSGCGYFYLNLDNNTAGQIKISTKNYVSTANLLTNDQDNPKYSIAANAIIYELDDHFASVDKLDGHFAGANFIGLNQNKTWRADIVISILGYSEDVKAGMNGFDNEFTITAARQNFNGSGYWQGSMFIPYENKVLTAYNNAYPAVDYSETWTWGNKSNISDEEMQFMLNFWGDHNVKTTSEIANDSTYTTTSGKSLSRFAGNKVMVGAKTATIKKSVTWYDGTGSEKTIYIIDDILYEKP